MRALALGWLTQRKWRTVGAVALAIAGGMALYGGGEVTEETSRVYLLVYWSVFLACFVVALYMAYLDLRYIRLQYLLSERDLYLETLGDEEFRKTLRQGKRGGMEKQEDE